MLKGLVDYGNDSEDEEFTSDNINSVCIPNINKDDNNELPDGFFDTELASKSGVLYNLPSMNLADRLIPIEGELEEFLVVRKNWEKKLADKAQKKQQKSKKKQIDAFGGLTLKSLSRTDKDDKELSLKNMASEPDIIHNEKPKCILLSGLPQPKSSSSKSSTLMIPSTVSKPKPLPSLKRDAPNVVSNIPIKRSLVQADSDSDEDTTDFFGFTSALKLPVPDTTDMDTNILDVPLFLNNVAPGPSKHTHLYVEHERTEAHGGELTNEAARKLIYEKELLPWGYSEHEAQSAVNNIIDVSVDKALGPNIRENLLKNLNNKALAQVSLGPIPKMKKDPVDKLAKQKHQITYLANQAVAREEQLQDQWAQNKQQKRMASQKYGF